MGAAVETFGSGSSGIARLYLDAVGTPVVTQVTARRQSGMTVERALPFLRLDSPVRDEVGRRGHIESVRVAIEDHTPRLILELVYDETGEIEADPLGVDDTIPNLVIAETCLDARLDTTIPWCRNPEAAASVEAKGRARRDPTVRWYGAPPRSEPVTIAPTAPARDDRDSVVVFSTAREGPSADGRVAIVPRRLAPPVAEDEGSLAARLRRLLAGLARAAGQALRFAVGLPA